jgi:ABC-2 type transport system ATP-binding protein
MEPVLMNALEVTGMTFNYPDKDIFQDANMSVSSYKITGLLGGNGAGKTTFFDLLCRIEKNYSGVVTNNFDYMLYLSQILTVPPALRMGDIAKMIVALCSKQDADSNKLNDYVDQQGFAVAMRYKEIMLKKSSLCSYGEKRWFFTMTLLAFEPDFIILDEPTAGVDPEYRHYIWQGLRNATKNGAAVLISSHNIEEIVKNCDCFYMINQQRFSKFDNGPSFMKFYGGESLDEAFRLASTKGV